MTIVPPPPSLASLPAGTQLIAGLGVSTITPTLDFETYSEAGFVWNDAEQKWKAPPGNAPQNNGLGAVGTAVYTEDPTCEILSLAYDLKDGRGRRRWKPGDPLPTDLLAHIASGGLIEAHNAGFERWVWRNVAVPRYGFPPLPVRQMRCSMAKARAFALPGALDNLGDVLNINARKDADGKRLLTKFSRPRNPTKNDPRRRIRPQDDPIDAAKLYAYNERDIEAESEASSKIPNLQPDELEFWFADQEINDRGVAVDRDAIRNCIAIVEQAYERYNTELHTLTGGAVEKASQLERLKGWLASRGVHLYASDEDAIDAALAQPGLDPAAKRALELRGLLSSASVKKLYALLNRSTALSRVHDLFSFHAARTGRAAGNDAQPQNLPRGGPSVRLCKACSHWSGAHADGCRWCGVPFPPGAKPLEWGFEAAQDALAVIALRSLRLVELFFGDALATISGCLKLLFVAADGHDLMASDYSAIEAVVLAALAGEEWRLEVFRTHGKIYETGASKITGIPFEEFERHKRETGSHHPARQKFGKVSELASGYGGWIGAWKQFGADEYFTDDEIVTHILAWRAASPAIPEFWGGQHRGRWWRNDYRQEYFGLEGAAIQAVLHPGREFTVHAPHPQSRAIAYFMRGDALYCRLPSGRHLTYHRPRLSVSTRQADELALSFEGWNTNPKMGPVGWIRMFTYGGKLCENVVQAVSRDILRDAIIRLQRVGYGVVLHVHDEIVAEIRKLWGSLTKFESLMNAHEAWAADWPVKASGGWRGREYRKS